MALDDIYDLSNLKNHTEELLFRIMEEELEKISDEDVCKCEDCVLDMVCMSLNKLAPRYRVSLMGSIYSTAQDGEFEEEVRNAVLEAVEKISLNRAHD
ncbi:MAG: late competence development ComFB family protein [Spirochaetales bacterium]|nr:late competence development ComFB family protein [Spirochaetales bacterium]